MPGPAWKHSLAVAGLATVLLLPWLAQWGGLHWVRVLAMCQIYILLAVGLNLIVGQAGLLDLGYIGFYAVGAYLYAWLNSPHLAEHFSFWQSLSASAWRTPWWLVLPAAMLAAALAGVLLGAPTLKLRGDYLAIVTLGFGEIIRLLIVNLDHPVNLTDGARGLTQIASLHVLGVDFNQAWPPPGGGGGSLAPVTLHALFIGAAAGLVLLVLRRLETSRTGRAWRALREDEMAAQAMGLNIPALKLLAFAIGAAIAGLAGALFASLQAFVSPESFSLQESVLVVAMVIFGGAGHLPGVVLGAVLLTGLPELLRYGLDLMGTESVAGFDRHALRPLLVALAMVVMPLWRSEGLWPERRGR